ncbi:GRIM-19 [Jimgerdemannia flammicorona]|uniref:NADH dehydrogenase [ubiquinone] 1 alpha subcomplex subunit 13 n=1 Tax=Jimgerdemannia flammicorona TaxID=994334 RepID=A0A433QI46_9FUNG|nr:GRIM-19 [Jimgerdemannia flammicorona]
MSAPQVTQDLPPLGGYPEVHYRRNIPKRGPSGAVIIGGVVAVCTFGWWRIVLGKVEKRELKRENIWARLHLVPLLTAEADRDNYRREQALLAREAAIMKDVEGWKVGESVYNNTKYYVPPAYVSVPESVKK